MDKPHGTPAQLRPATAAPTRNEAPLQALHVVVLDTETTGLDVRTDRIVQIGAIRMTGTEPHPEDRFDALVNPGIKIPERSTRIHHITQAMADAAPPSATVLTEFLAFLGDAVVVGHSIQFDLGILRHEAARLGIRWREPRALDTSLLAAALMPGLMDTSLENLATWFETQIHDRHTALGDAITTAHIYARMIPKLREAGVRTLAEAEKFQRRAAGLYARQEEAGWFAQPGDNRHFAAQTDQDAHLGRRAIDSFIYRHRLRDVMNSPPITIHPGATLREASQRMTDFGIGCLIVEPLEATRCGILTERDILWAFAQGDSGATTVAEAMTAPIIALPENTHLYRALGHMARRNLRYLGVTDHRGQVTGLFTLRSLLRQRALETLKLGDAIANATDSRGLAKAQAELPELAASLLAEGLDAREVAGIIAAEGRAMTARAAELAEAHLEQEGYGRAPAPYAVLVLGSGGRGESLLAPDQDNALVISDGWKGDLDSPDDWFTRFAVRMNTILDEAGVPFCKGGVMAMRRPFRRRVSEWKAEIDKWTASNRPENLLNVDIFYDFQLVHGWFSLGDTVRNHATQAVRHATTLLMALGEQAANHGLPLGLFGRFRTDDQGRIDMKGGALLPIVSGARVMALRHGIAALSTPKRLQEAAAAAGTAETDIRLLVDIHGFVLRLILEQQIADIAVGIPPSNRVDLKRLSTEDKKRLKNAFDHLGLLKDTVRDVLKGMD